MATNILMPALSPTMTEGTLARWLKQEGDTVKAGDVIAEIETDKATMEVEAVDEGVLGKILVADGTQGVKVNDPIAVLVDPGEKVPDAAAPAPAAAKPAPAAAGPAAEVVGETSQSPAPATPGRTEAPPRDAAPAAKGNGHDAGGERIFASPLARRMAQQAGIALSGLKGSGPNGRIVRADIEAAQKGGAQPAAQTSAGTPSAAAAAAAATAPVGKASAPAITAPHKLIPHSNVRKVIARRLTEAKSTIPHFYVSMDVEIDAMIELMGKLNAKSPQDREAPGWYFITINDLVIKAAAATLRKVPMVNAAWTDEGIAQFEDVDVSVAVAIPDGLITPIVRHADQKGLLTISREMKDLASRARAGKLKPEEFQGGGFSISNMGMFGVTAFSAIINPPQAAILAVAAGQKRPVVKDGELAVATVMTCTLSVDHRVVDGALGAQWLKAFKQIVEDPLSLML
ncbi:MAG: pyruvate dehydrogenase complex dihydrolipoamide acetyltransferase [Rhodospirillales bacterium]|nr:pyruvate dehydrogenase complex dihydrolipoamide acetyltransferase [Rhodospirillales bacterium]